SHVSLPALSLSWADSSRCHQIYCLIDNSQKRNMSRACECLLWLQLHTLLQPLISLQRVIDARVVAFRHHPDIFSRVAARRASREFLTTQTAKSAFTTARFGLTQTEPKARRGAWPGRCRSVRLARH